MGLFEDERAYEKSYALMKIKTISCQESDVMEALSQLMSLYNITDYPNLEDSCYEAEEHYFIDDLNNPQLDVCLLS